MPGKILLDTNVIIAFFSGEKAVSKRFMESEVFVSSTALGELYYGARKSAHASANLARIEEFAAAVKVLSCDARTAQLYGEVPVSRQTNSKSLRVLLSCLYSATSASSPLLSRPHRVVFPALALVILSGARNPSYSSLKAKVTE